ncbi:hypothetical protein GCM10020256_48870 [Streptomyces thermocoprophilus]
MTPAQARLEFSHGGREHTVPFEETDEDELVGAFTDEDGFHGFTVGPRGRLAVEVRLAFAADAVPDDVTVNAAVVQRHEDDGDWVGQSNDYRFTVREPSEEAPAEDVFPSEGRTETGTGTPSPRRHRPRRHRRPVPGRPDGLRSPGRSPARPRRAGRHRPARPPRRPGLHRAPPHGRRADRRTQTMAAPLRARCTLPGTCTAHPSIKV